MRITNILYQKFHNNKLVRPFWLFNIDKKPNTSDNEILKNSTSTSAARMMKKKSRMELMIALTTKKITTASNSIDTKGWDNKA